MKTLFLSALVLSALTANAAPAPTKVAFVGDYITTAWGVAAPNPNWTFYGEPASPFAGDSGGVAGAFPKVLATHPNVVHIMMGVVDESQIDDATLTLTTQNLLANLQTMVREAKAANVRVILGLEPGGWSPENAAVAAYGAANGILVLGYQGVPMMGTNIIDTTTFVPTPAGFAQMTQIATAAIATLNAPLQGGYLQDQVLASIDWPAQPQVNTWGPGAQIQFTAIGTYAGGAIYPQTNANIVGATGTWTSSNPLVMYIGPTGLAWTLSAGTAIIRYTSPNGIGFSEWVMHIQPAIE